MSEQGGRYFIEDASLTADPISGEKPIRLKYHAGGQWKESKSGKYMPCYNPSTGAVIALAPQCSSDEVEEAVQAAVEAFPKWSTTPVSKRVQVLYRMKALLDENLEELTVLLAKEMSKKYQEAMGDILKVTEVVEFACGAPHLMKGEALMQVSTNYDTALYREPIGVFAGISALELPCHDSSRLDEPHLHRHRQLHGFEGGQLCAPVGHAGDGALAGSGASRTA
jgi:malonate-semialdehyde dehydrogenase (acetylating)/methylmalonate-semialdehyde dehydrogenase